MKNNLRTKWTHLLAGLVAVFFAAGLSAQTFPSPGFVLPPGKTIVITYEVDVDSDVCPSGTQATDISNQSNVSGSNFPTVQTDDPDIGGSPGPTLTPVSSLSLGNLVYKDLNTNGLFDGADTGVDGVALNLYADDGDGVLDAGDGAAIATATTAGGGLYTFVNLCPGNYIVEVAPSNFNPGGALYDNGLMAALISSPVGGAPDPDNDVNNDDNGDPVAGFGVASQAITLSLGGEPITDGDADANTNLTLDFGFKNPTIVTINDVTMNEGTGGSTTSFNFTVTRTIPDEAFSLTVNTMDGTATDADNDYEPISGGTVSFTAGGSLTETVTVLVNHDNKVEANETFTVVLSGAPAGIVISDDTGLGAIDNDDAATVTLSGGAAQNEGNSGTTAYTFTATLNNPVQGGFTVPYTTNDVTATTADNDYTDNDGTFSFAGTAGEAKTITVNTTTDNKVELDETFTVALGAITGAPAGVTTAGSPQTGTITNDDQAVASFTTTFSGNEGNSGTQSYTFTFNLSNPVDALIEFGFSHSDGTATLADNDYLNAGGAFTVPIGTFGNILVGNPPVIQGDTKVEANEIFNVVLSANNFFGRNVVFAGGGSSITNPVTIVNDDAAVVTLTGGGAANEGNTGTTSRVFTATLNNAVQGGFTVPYTTNDGTATTADNDYTDNDGTLNFTGTAGETKTITVLVNGDFFVEADETFTVALGVISGAPAGVTTAGSPQTGTITNDEIDYGDIDDFPGLGAPFISTLLSNNGARHNATLTGPRLGSALDGDPDGQISANADGDDTDAEGDDEDGVVLPNPLIKGTTANVAVTASAPGVLNAWVDFEDDFSFDQAGNQVFTNVPLVIGVNNLSFTVPVAASTTSQTYARFRISTASGLTPYGLAADGEVEDYQVAIIDNLFSIDNPSVVEGNAGTTSLVFTVSRTTNATASSVDYAITGGTATSGSDYVPLPAGTINFPMGGALSQTVTVTVNGDLVVEDNETVIITLSNPVNGGLGANPGAGTITNDDNATLTLTQLGTGSILEGTGPGTTTLPFRVTLNNDIQGGVMVDYETQDGTATLADMDYTDNDGTLNFTGTAGEFHDFDVVVTRDNKVEPHETIQTEMVALSLVGVNPIFVTFAGANPQIATITNDDQATVTITPVSQAEGTGGTTDFNFTVTLDNPVQDGFTLDFNVQDGTATDADDFDPITLSPLAFAGTANEMGTIVVRVNGDNKVEANETFPIELVALNLVSVNPLDVTTAGFPALGTILNDDAATVTLTPAGGIMQNEGNTGTTPFVYTATLNNPVQGGFTVPYTTNDGLATTANNDYQDNDGTLTFAGTMGEAPTITVLVNGDFFVEANEGFTVALGAISGAPAGVTTAGSPQSGLIVNDEIDFGDAPDSYGTLLASNGARHVTSLIVHLGATVDGDPDGQPGALADGDDTDAEGNDDDGVTLPNPLVTNTTANITVNASIAGFVNGWVDFDLNGSFDAGELVLNQVAVAAGDNSLSFAVPNGAIPGSSYARFRFTQSAVAAVPTGLQTTGEVEDYAIQIVNTQFTINDPTVTEGNAGTTNLAFVISRSNNASACSVNYAITGGTATVADLDYQALAAGTASFTAGGVLNQTINVVVNGDVKVELNETVDMTLSAPVNGSILDGSGTGAIVNDDAAVITITNPTVTEGDVPNTFTATFTINMSNPSDANVSVNYNTVDNSATLANNDYQSASGTHTFTPGQLSKTVAVTVVGDCNIEANETYFLRLSGLVNNGRNIALSGGGATLDGTGTINNDDALPVITCPANLTVNAAAGTCAATVTIPGPFTSSLCGNSVLEFRYRTVDANNVPTGAFTAYAPAASNTVSFAVNRYEIEWRITDGSGASTCSFFLQVNDTQPPSITCPANQNVNAGPTCTGTVGAWSPAALSDNCAPPPPTVVQTPPASTVLSGHNDSELVTLTATDEYGNTASCSFTVTLKDVTPPVAICKNATINLGANGSVTVNPTSVNNGSTDNCGLTLTVTPNVFTCANIGTNTVTLKATDPGGNMATCTAVVTIKDATPPTALCKTINVFLDDNGYASITPASVNNGSFDACGIATMTISQNEFDCGQINGSPVVVQLTLKDNYNNQSSCLANVYVKDNIAPTAVCDDVTVNLGANGKVTVQTAPLAANSTDNCSVWSYLPVAKVYTAFNLGVNNLAITVKDWSGNASTCVSQVTVLPAGSEPNDGGSDTEMQSTEPADVPAAESAVAPPAEPAAESRVLDLYVFPNPTADDVTVVFLLDREQPYTLRLFDLNGRLLRQEQLEGFAGENYLTLQLGEFPTGLYFLDILSDLLHGRQKIVVQKD